MIGLVSQCGAVFFQRSVLRGNVNVSVTIQANPVIIVLLIRTLINAAMVRSQVPDPIEQSHNLAFGHGLFQKQTLARLWIIEVGRFDFDHIGFPPIRIQGVLANNTFGRDISFD